MKEAPVVAVICEFNPYHNGHHHLLQSIRKDHENATILCIMSGNYVQRGEPAVADKYLRSKIAVLNGADLVLELPLPYSVMDAQGFARGAIHIIGYLGGVDYLYFGSESGNIHQLTEVAENTTTETFVSELNKTIRNHPEWIYPKAVIESYIAIYNKIPPILGLDTPNDILAVEYLKEIAKQKLRVIPHAIKRIGTGHNDPTPKASYASATAIRRLTEEGQTKQVEAHMTPNAFRQFNDAIEKGRAPIATKNYQPIILSKLREQALANTDFSSFLYCEPLAEKMKNNIPKAISLPQLWNMLKSKDITMSRIKRALLSCYLEIPKESKNWLPEQTQVLALTNNGCKYLSSIRKTKSIRLITKPAHIKSYAKDSSQILLNLNADRRFTMFYSGMQPESLVFTQTPFVREE